jgi:hypothetical protein
MGCQHAAVGRVGAWTLPAKTAFAITNWQRRRLSSSPLSDTSTSWLAFSLSTCRTQVMFADQPWNLTTCRRMITMKHIRVKVDRIGPCDCAGNRINGHLRKIGRFPQLVEKTLTQGIFKIELPDETVSKGQAKAEVSQMFNLRNPG